MDIVEVMDATDAVFLLTAPGATGVVYDGPDGLHAILWLDDGAIWMAPWDDGRAWPSAGITATKL